MNSPPETRFWNIAFKVYEALPRQGPGSRASTARALELCGPLPEEAWRDDFYTPMLARIAELREQCADDEATVRILDEIAQEPAMHRSFGSFYAYEFFIARKPPERRSP